MFDECDPTTVVCCSNVESKAPKTLWKVFWPCARCVVVRVREVASLEGEHDVEHVTEMRQRDTTWATVKLARETDDTTSGMVKLARD